MTHRFDGYEPFAGNSPREARGRWLAWNRPRLTKSTAPRPARFFIDPGQDIYADVGESSRDTDMGQPHKGKKLTNMRASGADKGRDARSCRWKNSEFINDDEYLEVTQAPGFARPSPSLHTVDVKNSSILQLQMCTVSSRPR